MNTKSLAASAAVLTVLATAGGVAWAAQDRSTLKVPDGLAFSEFEGSEAWVLVAGRQTPGSLTHVQLDRPL